MQNHAMPDGPRPPWWVSCLVLLLAGAVAMFALRIIYLTVRLIGLFF